MNNVWFVMGGSFMLGCVFMAIIDAFILHRKIVQHTENLEYRRCESLRHLKELEKSERENESLKRKINEIQKALCER